MRMLSIESAFKCHAHRYCKMRNVHKLPKYMNNEKKKKLCRITLLYIGRLIRYLYNVRIDVNTEKCF